MLSYVVIKQVSKYTNVATRLCADENSDRLYSRWWRWPMRRKRRWTVRPSRFGLILLHTIDNKITSKRCITPTVMAWFLPLSRSRCFIYLCIYLFVCLFVCFFVSFFLSFFVCLSVDLSETLRKKLSIGSSLKFYQRCVFGQGSRH